MCMYTSKEVAAATSFDEDIHLCSQCTLLVMVRVLNSCIKCLILDEGQHYNRLLHSSRYIRRRK